MECADNYRQNLKQQLRESYGRMLYTYTIHLKSVDIIIRRVKWMKRIQIILSAASTVGFFSMLISSESFATAATGLSATVLLALNLFLGRDDSDSEILQHKNTADCLWKAKEEYLALLTDFDILDENSIRIRRDKLSDILFNVYSKAPKTSPRAYKLTQNALQNKEEQFFSSEELDILLPPHLRSTITEDSP